MGQMILINWTLVFHFTLQTWDYASGFEFISGLSLTLVYSSTNMSKSVWTSGFWKPLVHKNMSNFWNNIFHKFSIASLVSAYFVCSRCGRVNFGVDEWLFWTTRPQYKCLKIHSERPVYRFLILPYLSVAVFSSFWGWHLDNFAWTILNHHVPIFTNGRSLHGICGRCSRISTFEFLIFIDIRHFSTIK